MLRRAGTYYVIGYGGMLNVPAIDIISTEISFVGCLVGTYNDLAQLMTLAGQGKVKLHTSMTRSMRRRRDGRPRPRKAAGPGDPVS